MRVNAARVVGATVARSSARAGRGGRWNARAGRGRSARMTPRAGASSDARAREGDGSLDVDAVEAWDARGARVGERASAAVAASALSALATARAANAATGAIAELALDPEGAKAVSAVLGPLFAVSTILFIVRIVMTWYPSVPYTKLPWAAAYFPTEPLLKPTRALVPPVGGVDVSPIIWVGMISFMNEILLGKQGLLVLLANKQLGGGGPDGMM